MRVSDKALVLQAVKYGDKKLILKLFTKHNGLLTVAVSVGNSRTSKIKPGIISNLTLLDVEIIKKQNNDVHRLTEATCYYVHSGIPNSFSKLSIAQFLNEILIKSVKEQAPNSYLFDFIEGCLKYLNESESDFVNLHVYFLIELTKYLGIEPNNNYSNNNCFFDCREGQFTGVNLTFPMGLDKDESALFTEILKVNCLNEKLSNQQRNKLLEILIAYYQMHVPGFNNVKSIEVLKEVVMV